MKYEQLAQHIINNIDGKENIISVVSCTTRLRFKLNNQEQAQTEMLKKMPGVITVVQS